MAKNFLQQQLISSGRFAPKDSAKIASLRGKHNRLGFAYQLIFVRLLNCFPKQSPFEIIDEVLLFASLQLDIDTENIKEYQKHRQHIARHQENICQYLELSEFSDSVSEKLSQFIFEKAQQLEHASVLLGEARQFLKAQNCLEPGEDALVRLVGTQKEKARQSIFSALMGLLSKTKQKKLDRLLIVPEGRSSKLQRLKNPPAEPSADAFLNLVEKLDIIDDLQVHKLDLSWLNNNYQRSQSKYVQRCSADRLRELKPENRYTALICFLRQLCAETIDQMLDMYFKLITKVYKASQAKIDAEIVKKRKSIKAALRMLKTIGGTLLDETVPDADLRKVLFEKVDKVALESMVSDFDSLISGKLSHVFKQVLLRFSYLRRFSPSLLKYINFETEPKNKQGARLLKAVKVLRQMNLEEQSELPDNVPLGFIPKKLKNIVAPQREKSIGQPGSVLY